MNITDLPVDLLIQDLCPRLDFHSLIALSGTCRQFQTFCNDEAIWKKLVLREFHIPVYATFRNRGWKEIYSKLHDPVVYTWGEGTYYRLGHKQREVLGRARNIQGDEDTPRELESLRGKKIIDIVAGGWSFHALDRDGNVWVWGMLQAEWPISRGVSQQPIKTPTLVEIPQGVKIASIACGRSHAIGLSTEGKVYHWNHIKKVQEILLPSTSSRVIQVSGNWGYSSLLTAAGEIFIVPQPENAEDDEVPILTSTVQGLGITLRNYVSDALAMGQDVNVIPGDMFVQIASMEGDTLALSRKGKVYKFGTAQLIERETEEEEERLGEGPPVFLSNPAATGGELRHYSSPDQNDIVDSDGNLTMFISSFFHNFAVYTLDGAVKLGTARTTAEDEPTTRPELNSNICKVTFGDYHSGALTNDGDLLTWGSYSRGALGHGSAGLPRRNFPNRYAMMAPEPEIAPRKIEALQNMFVFAASFGGWHSACLAFRR
ncbi:hypothetical protein INT44_000326 [Umbelopsis vinacea]|uniref:F-box domain-containing protein n=1 Tax=Umbelopsis vinacea TaxID=44442 RepID=A0A8H7PKV2_9FUNG|nr:hypothetical protein INT44_000326 [Umbelopsis vinacea]